MQIDSDQLELLYGVIALLLPDGVLDHFELVKLDEEDAPVPADGSYTPYKRKVHLYLDERDERTSDELTALRPNGFTEYTMVTDYPVRNRLLTLHMRRRRYINPDGKNTILCIYPLKANGTSISASVCFFFKRRSLTTAPSPAAVSAAVMVWRATISARFTGTA